MKELVVCVGVCSLQYQSYYYVKMCRLRSSHVAKSAKMFLPLKISKVLMEKN